MRSWTPTFVAFLFLSAGLHACKNAAPAPEKADPQELQTIKSEESSEKSEPEKINSSPVNEPLPALPDPVAIVNDKAISLAEFKDIYDLKVARYTNQGREIPASVDRRFRKRITERLIEQEILRQEAAKQGVVYDAEKLKAQEEEQKQGVKDWASHLEKRGESATSLRNTMISELLELALLEKANKLTVTEQEVDEEYQKIKDRYKSDEPRMHVAHILIPSNPANVRVNSGEKAAPPTEEEAAKMAQEAEQKALEVYKLATASGADFAALVKQYSQRSGASTGGELPPFTQKGRMDQAFSDAAFALKPGQISKPVKTKFGWHIMKAIAKYPPGELPKQALEQQIRERIYQRKLRESRRQLKEELASKYTVINKMEEVLGPDPQRPSVRPPSLSTPAPGMQKAIEPKDIKGEEKSEEENIPEK